jgi:carboxymethylenebutenolidase
MGDPLPAVILLHEWWGLNDDIRALADRVAAEGYIVLAVDLFSGQTATSLPAARKLMLSVVEDPANAELNIQGAYTFLNEVAGAPKIAAVGWGFGGAWALNSALLYPDELDAAVVYYGQVTGDETLLQPLNVPVLGIFAENDRGIRTDSVRAFESALTALEKDFEIEIYPGVGHAFANPSGKNYDATTTALAWENTLSFLRRTLMPDGNE